MENKNKAHYYHDFNEGLAIINLGCKFYIYMLGGAREPVVSIAEGFKSRAQHLYSPESLPQEWDRYVGDEFRKIPL